MIKAGSQQKDGAPYCGQTSGGSSPDVAAVWEETFFPDEFRTYNSWSPSNALYGTLPQINNAAFTNVFPDGFFWVQSHIPKLFTGNTVGVRISFYNGGGSPNPYTFTFGFGARGFNSGAVIDQNIVLTNQNTVTTPVPITDKIWYCGIPLLTVQGDATPGNFIYLRCRRIYPSNDYIAAVSSFSVTYPLSENYSL